MTLDEQRLQRAFAVASEFVERGDLQTAMLGVATSDGRWAMAFGSANSGQPAEELTSTHQFLLASVSKPITGLAVMKLVEEGRLVLSAPVQTIIPEFAAPGKPDITVWHLMTHTSGIADVYWDATDPAEFTEDGVLRRAVRAVPQFWPGTKWQYNTLTFTLLGEIVHRIDGRPFDAYMQQEILDPLGIHGLVLDPARLGEQVVAPLNVSPTPAIPNDVATRLLSGAKLPGAGYWSDMESLLGLAEALLRDARTGEGRILAPATLSLMTSLHTDGIPRYEMNVTTCGRYGLTWHKPTTLRERVVPGSATAFSHSGATGTVLWIDPEYDLAVTFLTNHWGIGDDFWMKCLQAVYAAIHSR